MLGSAEVDPYKPEVVVLFSAVCQVVPMMFKL